VERLFERIQVAQKALDRFAEAMAIVHPSELERDAIIQRFEFTFEATWKAAKQYLYDIEGIDNGSPKGVIRSCREIGILDDQQTVCALQMVNDRNLTVHTYNEALAVEIYTRMRDYQPVLELLIREIRQRV